MINIAGVETCDETIKEELEEAGIGIVDVGKMKREVPASIIGKCNNFIFGRAWYYWIVEGYMPLEVAQKIHKVNLEKELSIRVSGNCTNPPPEKWVECKGWKEKFKPFFQDFLDEKISLEEADKIGLEIKSQGEQFVTHYHIDTQEGLNYFVKVIKENNIIG